MAEKTPAEKMRLKEGMKVLLLHVPPEVQPRLGIPPGTASAPAPERADFILLFASSQAEAEERLRSLKPLLGDKAVAWLAYPKGSKGAGYDLNRDTLWTFARSIGLDFVSNVSIDGTWSALRFRPAT